MIWGGLKTLKNGGHRRSGANAQPLSSAVDRVSIPLTFPGCVINESSELTMHTSLAIGSIYVGSEIDDGLTGTGIGCLNLLV